MARVPHHASTGFSLVEVMLAVFLLSIVSVGIAHLAALSVMHVWEAREQTGTTLLAVQKMEQLRSLAWEPGAGAADERTDLSTDPPSAGGTGLRPSPVGSLEQNTPGYVDYLDRSGAWVGTGGDPPPGTVFIRRWSVRPAATGRDTIVLQVRVTVLRREVRRVALGGRMPGDGWLVTARSRPPE